MSEVKIPSLSTPTRGIVVEPSVAMMEQQFPGYYSVYGGGGGGGGCVCHIHVSTVSYKIAVVM